MIQAVSSYIRQFYRGNLFGATENSRNGQQVRSLFPADVKAIRRALKGLGAYDYDGEGEADGQELVDKVQAFADTYNHYIESAKGMDDESINRYLSKMKKLTKEHAGELAEIGITIQSSGKMKVNKKTLQESTRYQVSVVFSEDAAYSKQTDRLMRQSFRMFQRNGLDIPRKGTQAAAANSTAGSAAMASAQAAAAAAMASAQATANSAAQAAGNHSAGNSQQEEENLLLAQQYAQGIAGNRIDYMV